MKTYKVYGYDYYDEGGSIIVKAESKEQARRLVEDCFYYGTTHAEEVEEDKIEGNLLDKGTTHFGPQYGDKELLEKMLIGKRLKAVYKDRMILEDGTIITIECSEQDCCADADGSFEFSNWNNENLDAVITNIVIHEPIEVPDYDTHVMRNTISVFNNQNVIALANAQADAGNGGYYYSIASLVINEIHFPFVEA